MDPKSPEHYTNRRSKSRLRRAINYPFFPPSLYILGILICAVFLHYFILSQSYSLTPAEARLLSKTAVDNGQVSFKDGTLSYNQANQSKDGAAKLTVSGATNSTSKQAYRVALASKVSSGIKFTDASSDLPFKLIPLTTTNNGRYIDGHMVYPSENAVGIYTLRRNGIKEDIILNQSPGSSYSYAWKLDLGTQLAARMLPDGGVGIYSANPLLSSSNLQVSDAKSQALIDKAKKAGKKDTLIYVIPAPYITQSTGVRIASNVKFNLTGSTLTLTATGLDALSIHYPISIDPTVVVTTTADFSTGYDDGNIDYSTADEIDRAGIGTGLVGTWNYTSNSTNNGASFLAGFTRSRYGHTIVAYNGYLYILGGHSSTAANDCSTGNFCNGVQFAPINADGTIGAWHFTHNSTDDGATFVAGFMTPRANHTSVAYNGYLYVIGGKESSVSDDCGVLCNGVQFAPINANGTVGAWHFTHNSTDDGTTFVDGFNQVRNGQTSVAYNGYLYVIGGQGGNSKDCTTSGNFCNGVQFAPINANGTIGTWNYTHNSGNDGVTFVSGFIRPRAYHTSAAYNGYLYLIGGQAGASGDDCTASSNYCNGVQYASVNADGTVGVWHYTSANTDNSTTFSAGFSQARGGHTSIAYNGYIYVIGGANGAGTGECSLGYCSGIQYAPINANGTVGAWHFTHNSTDDSTTWVTGFNNARSYLGTAAYNGYLYVIGGQGSGSQSDCSDTDATLFYCNGVQFASLTTLRNTAGPAGTWNYTHNSINDGATFSAGFTQPRSGHSSVAYNGYLYVIGGVAGTSASDCTTGSSSFACNGVQFAPINANGTIGTWNYTHNSTNDGSSFVSGFNTPRASHTAVAYNGYLYVIGGQALSSGGDCTSSGNYCNGVQFAPINANGTIGTWNYTHNSTNDGSSFVSGFTQPRYGHTSAVYNGYLYVMGGVSRTQANDCTLKWISDSACNGVQFAPINANGTIGTWNYTGGGSSCASWASPCSTNGFIHPRYQHASVVYADYMYVIGGQTPSNSTQGDDCTSAYFNCNGVQFAKINSDGTIVTWAYTHNGINDGATFVSGFTTPRDQLGSVITNGRLYIVGGEGQGGMLNDIQYALVNNNGTVGSFTTNSTSLNLQRQGFGMAIYNNSLYVTGGIGFSNAAPAQDCTVLYTSNEYYCSGAQFASLSAGNQPSFGTVNTFTSSSNNFTTARSAFAATAYNGYLYIAGGDSGTGNTCNGSGVQDCNDIQYAQINSDGSIGSFTTSPIRFTTPRLYLGLVAYNGFLYIVGGLVSSGTCNGSGSNGCNDIQYAQLASNGSIGNASFTTNTNRLSGLVSDFTAFAYNGYLYAVGNSYTSQIEYAKISINGSVGTFSVSSNTYASGRANSTSTVYNGYIYVTGGYVSAGTCNGSGSVDCNDVQYAKINSGGSIGTFTTSANRITGVREAPIMHAYNGYLYVAGGYDSVDATCNGNSSSYCNDVQYAQINSDGSIGTFTTSSNRFTSGRYQFAGAASGGYLYITGGWGSCGAPCSDLKYASLNSPEKAATYEKIVDFGTYARFVSLSFNGQAVCGLQINYRLGDANGSFGSVNTIISAFPTFVYFPSYKTGRYLWVQFKMDDAVCGTNSQITDFTANYNLPSAAPTLSAPANNATGVGYITFNLATTDADSDYLRYKIDLCSTSNCSAIITTIDQTSSQTGWSGQDQQSGTAYTGATVLLSSTTAVNSYYGAISKNTQYWWRAYAIDPGGSNIWSPVSSINTFTTGDTPPTPPSLLYPVSSSSGNSVFTAFQLRSTESNSDYLRYWIDVCADSACSSIIRSICQQNTGTGVPDGGACTSSQTGWSGQDQQTGTAYSGNPTITLSQLAVHNYQSPYLTKNTTYWWRAYAIDPGGSNTWSGSSAIQSFTTAPTETHLQGTIKIQGNVKL